MSGDIKENAGFPRRERERMPDNVKEWLRNNGFVALQSFQRNMQIGNMFVPYLKEETNPAFRHSTIRLAHFVLDSWKSEEIAVQLSAIPCAEDKDKTIYESYKEITAERSAERKKEFETANPKETKGTTETAKPKKKTV